MFAYGESSSVTAAGWATGRFVSDGAPDGCSPTGMVFSSVDDGLAGLNATLVTASPGGSFPSHTSPTAYPPYEPGEKATVGSSEPTRPPLAAGGGHMNPVEDATTPDIPVPPHRVRRALWAALGVAVAVGAGGRYLAMSSGAPAQSGQTTSFTLPSNSRFGENDPFVQGCKLGEFRAEDCVKVLTNDTYQLDPVIKPFIDQLDEMFGDRYGGHWFDARVRPSLFVIGVVEPTDAERARIAELAGHNPRVVVQAMRYSRARQKELELAMRDVIYRMARGDRQLPITDPAEEAAVAARAGQLVRSLGFNVKSQKFAVNMPSPNPELEARIRAIVPADDLDLRICGPGSEASGGPCTPGNPND